MIIFGDSKYYVQHQISRSQIFETLSGDFSQRLKVHKTYVSIPRVAFHSKQGFEACFVCMLLRLNFLSLSPNLRFS